MEQSDPLGPLVFIQGCPHRPSAVPIGGPSVFCYKALQKAISHDPTDTPNRKQQLSRATGMAIAHAVHEKRLLQRFVHGVANQLPGSKCPPLLGPLMPFNFSFHIHIPTYTL